MKLFANLARLQIALPILALTLVMASGASFAQQIVIDEHSTDRKIAGDFFCSPCYSPLLSDSESINIASKTLTTGELYKYFQSRGITKLNRLALQVDVDCDPLNDKSFSLTDLSFQIQDSAKNLVTHAGLGDAELLLDSSEITSFKPEAVLEFELGYDFMQRFSPESTEAVVMNFQTSADNQGLQPRIVVSEEMSSFSTVNFLRLLAFVTFWGVVFYGAYLLTHPSQSGRPRRPSPVKSTSPAGNASAAPQ